MGVTDGIQGSGWTPRQRWLAAGGGTVLLAVFFIVFAGIDLWVSGRFWTATEGWYLGHAWWVMLFYKGVPLVVYTLAAALPIVALVNLLRRRAMGPFDGRALLFIFAAVALGPGLVVNVVLKGNWGRARPRDVVQFGGQQTFTPAFVISDQCPTNCSFVAGHPSMAFALLSVVLVAARRRRVALVAGVLALGAAVGLGRIVQGGHFLSDVVFSGIITVALVLWLYRLFGVSPPPDDAADERPRAAA